MIISCPALQVVYEFCLNRISFAGGRRPWLSSPGLCIVHGGVSRTSDLLDAENRRVLLCWVHIAWLDDFYNARVFGVPSSMSLTVLSLSFEFNHGSVLRLCVFAFCHERVLSFFARPQNKKHKYSLFLFHSISVGPSIDDVGWASKSRVVGTDDGTLYPRRSSDKTHNHILLRPRGRAARWIATPLTPNRNSTTSSRTRWRAWWSKSGARRISSRRTLPCFSLSVGWRTACWRSPTTCRAGAIVSFTWTLHDVLVKMCKVSSRPLSASIRMSISIIHKIDVNSV